MGWMAHVTTHDQHDLANSSINYMAVAYNMCYQDQDETETFISQD